MALSQPRQLFGVHSVSPYKRADGTFYGILHVLGSSSLNLQGEVIEVNGGSSKYSWAVEDGKINAEMNLKPKEFPDFLFELFLGKKPTAVSTDTAGTIMGLANKNGVSVVNATTGITSVIPKTANKADMKFGTYVLVATDATHVDVYVSSDVDFGHGASLDFASDLLKITATPLLVPGTGGTVDIPSVGLTIDGGSGTVAFVAGDTAVFKVSPPSASSMSVMIGSKASVFPEFGAIIVGQRRSDGSMVEIEAFRCKGVGLPLGFDEFKWAETDIKAKVFYDSAKDAVFELRHIIES